MGIYDNPEFMWFGTERKMRWIEIPQTGADVSPVGTSAPATLINGGGWTRESWASHKEYQLSWGNTTSKEVASTIHSYASGTYGRGLVYFLDPMYMDSNILPKWWADPSMAINYEAPSLVRDVQPAASVTPDNLNDYPVDGALYSVPADYDPDASATELVIPVPPDHSLLFGAAYTGSGATISLKHSGGTTVVAQSDPTDVNVVTEQIDGEDIVRIGINGSGDLGSIVIYGMTARIVPTSDVALYQGGPWVAGEGNSGCRFSGKPTLVNYGGLFGGQVGVAATLIEVGGWE